jgi:hypothetical protein
MRLQGNISSNHWPQMWSYPGYFFKKIAYSGVLRLAALVRTYVSKEHGASLIRVTRIGGLGTILAVTINRRALRFLFLRSLRRLIVTATVVPSSPFLATLMTEALRSFQTSLLTGATRRCIPEDGILHSHRRENFKSYIALTVWTL